MESKTLQFSKIEKDIFINMNTYIYKYNFKILSIFVKNFKGKPHDLCHIIITTKHDYYLHN